MIARSAPTLGLVALAGAILIGFCSPGAAQGAAGTAAKGQASQTDAKSEPKKAAAAPDAAFTKSKDPIYITADRLDIYDKEGRAVYSGPSGVVATQGPSKLVGSELTAYYDRQKDNNAQGGNGQPAGGATSGVSSSSVKRIVVKGPVSVVQNDQVATGDNADFDRVKNIVILTGHVSLTQGPNVTTGDKLVYDLNTGVANVYSAPGTPVKSLFVQGSENDSKQAKDAKGGKDTKTSSEQKPASGKAGTTKPAAKKAVKSE